MCPGDVMFSVWVVVTVKSQGAVGHCPWCIVYVNILVRCYHKCLQNGDKSRGNRAGIYRKGLRSGKHIP